MEPFDRCMQTPVVNNFFYNLKKKSKQPPLPLPAMVAGPKAGKIDMMIMTMVVESHGECVSVTAACIVSKIESVR